MAILFSLQCTWFAKGLGRLEKSIHSSILHSHRAVRSRRFQQSNIVSALSSAVLLQQPSIARAGHL